jgi:hypothetical protein
MKIFNTETVNNIIKKRKKGQKITRSNNIFYNGNVGTRKSNLSFLYTQEELIEYSRCYNDPLYFIDKYCKRTLTDDTQIDIKLFDYQKNVLDVVKDNKFTILLNSYQMGISTILSCFFLHYITFNSKKSIYVLSHKTLLSIEVINIMKSVYYNLPFFLKGGIINWNLKNITFDNESRIISGKFPVAIGSNADIVYIIDFAHIPDDVIEKEYVYIVPAVSTSKDSKLIISSSPNGYNYFYKLFQDAEAGKNDFKPVKVYWWQYPGRDEKWKENKIKIIGEKSFSQHYNLEFFRKD